MDKSVFSYCPNGFFSTGHVWKEGHFSTGNVEVVFVDDLSTEMFSTINNPCGKVGRADGQFAPTLGGCRYCPSPPGIGDADVH